MPRPQDNRRHLEHVLDQVYGQPHVVTQTKLEEVCDLLDRRLADRATVEELIAFPPPVPRDQDEPPYRVTAGGVAILPLQGIIAQRIGLVGRISGGTSSEQFTAAFNQAIADPAVKAIVIDANSPGGGYGGTPEAAAAVYAGRTSGKRIVAVANTQMDSGAYWIGSAADEVVASESATLGSVGVYIVHADTSTADQKAGIKRTVIKAGRWKAIHEGAAPLDPAERAQLQARADGIYDLFVEAVARNRGVSAEKVRADFGEGDSMLARDAVAAGLANRVATLDQVIAELESHTGGVRAPSGRAAGVRPTTSIQSGAIHMDPKVKAALVALGLCEPQVSDESAQAVLTGWFAGRGQVIPIEAPAIVAALLGKTESVAMVPPVAPMPPVTPAGPTADEVAEKVHARIKADEAFRVKTIRAQCDLVGMSADATGAILNLGLDPEASAAKIKEQIANDPGNHPLPRLVPGAAEKDKFCGVVQEAMDARFAISSLGLSPEEASRDLRPEGRKFLTMRLCDIAEQTLRMEGHDTRNMSKRQIGILALQSGGHAVIAGEGMAYYGTGSFSNLMLNASHKLLVRAYQEAPTTWQLWARRGDPAADYKLHSLIQLSAAGNLEETPENAESPTDTGLTDAREYYQVAKFTRTTSFSYESMVNDELGGLARIQRMQGNAAARTVNALAYAVLTNGTVALMADGGALFNATAVTTAGGHANLAGTGSTTAAPPSVVTLNALQGMVGIQRDINAETYVPLNLSIANVVVPMALRGTLLKFCRSVADPADANPESQNIWKGLNPVVEPLLDAVSTACWYVTADPSAIDTVVVFHLQGEETPVLESWWEPRRGTRFYKVQQSTAAIPADYRGLAKHVGFSA